MIIRKKRTIFFDAARVKNKQVAPVAFATPPLCNAQ